MRSTLAPFILIALLHTTAFAEDAPLRIWTTHSAHKVMEDEIPPATPASEMRIAASRNEFEAAQLVIRASAPLEDFEVRLGNLDGESGGRISRRYIEVRYAAYVPLPHYNRTAPDPLPLLDRLDVPAHQNLPLFFIVEIPRGARAGNYTAPITLRWKGGNVRTSLHLTVWNITLPKTPTCVTAFGYQKDQIAGAHGLEPSSPEAHDLYIAYFTMMLDYRISPFHSPVHYESRGAWSFFEDPRLTSYVIQNPEDDAGLIKIARLLKQNKWWDKGFFYPVDEPVSRESYDLLHRKAERIKQIAPGARICAPFYRRPDFDESKTAIDIAKDDVNIWCVNSHHWNTDPRVREGMREMSKRGDALWWYVCCGPERPYSNFFLDMDGMDHRMLFWQQRREGIQGLLYWSATWWHPDQKLGTGADPWTDMATIKSINPNLYGDGSLFYPGSKVGFDGPVPSQRLLIIRDGIEDFDYLTLLGRKHGPEAVREAIAELVTSMTDYSKDTNQLENVRNAMARRIMTE